MDQQPIFILGAGRCGSTFWQCTLCRTQDIWIWGEHAGVLSSLVRSCETLAQSSKLLDLSRAKPESTTPENLSEGDATALAWMNGFTASEYQEHITAMIKGLFASALPSGKKRWGFKEIRYGAAKDPVATFLLKAFPESLVVHSVRHPRATIESWINALHPVNKDSVDATDSIVNTYRQQATRVAGNMAGLIELAEQFPSRVERVFLENIDESKARLQKFLATTIESPTTIVNSGARAHSAARKALYEKLWEESSEAFTDIIKRLDYN